MGNRGLDVHCIRKQEWKLRMAQGAEGEIYLNDRTTQSKRSAWLAKPELYNVALDPAESYDVARMHPEIVTEFLDDLEKMISTFPPQVIEAYADLKAMKGGISTPPGAAPRPTQEAQPNWSWEPEDRRGL
jgi:arylsulfatase A